jgi:hypothetical protein
MGHVAVVELLLKANARVNEDANEVRCLSECPSAEWTDPMDSPISFILCTAGESCVESAPLGVPESPRPCCRIAARSPRES